MNLLQRAIGKAQRMKDDLIFNSGIGVTHRFAGINHFILMYHGVDSAGNTAFNRRHTAESVFEKHIRFLKKHCQIVTLEDFFMQKFKPGKVNVALTFDDGLENNFRIAKPILEKYKAPASFFITGLNQTEDKIIWADFIDIVATLTEKRVEFEQDSLYKKGNEYYSEKYNMPLKYVVKQIMPEYEYKRALYKSFEKESSFKINPDFDEYWKLMRDEQIKELGKSDYISVGSHGFLHNNLGNIQPESAKNELTHSKAYLENLTQRDVNSIAYPDGSYSRELVDFSHSIGIKYNLAAEGLLHPEDSTDQRIRDRKGIYTCDTAGNQLLCNFK